MSLAEASQHDLLKELQLHLAVPQFRDTPQRIREARGVAALREAHELLFAERQAESATLNAEPEPITALAMTVDHYDRLVRLNPEGQWPPRSTLISWFGGSWGSALRAARLPAAPGGDSVKMRNGHSFTQEEAYEALRECAQDLGHVPSLSEYRRWATTREVLGRPGRRPTSQQAFNRIAGGWQAALEASGLLGMGNAGPVQAVGSYRPAAYRFSPEQIHEAIREVAGRIGRSPRSTDYTRERELMQAEESAAGERVIARPSYQVINRLYDTWDDALIDAGLEALGGRATGRQAKRMGPPLKWTEDELLAAVARCSADFDSEYVQARTYISWRKAHQEIRNLPSYESILERLVPVHGRWHKIVNAALERAHPQHQPPDGPEAPMGLADVVGSEADVED